MTFKPFLVTFPSTYKRSFPLFDTRDRRELQSHPLKSDFLWNKIHHDRPENLSNQVPLRACLSSQNTFSSANKKLTSFHRFMDELTCILDFYYKNTTEQFISYLDARCENHYCFFKFRNFNTGNFDFFKTRVSF
jgi:hypothetical protein